MRSRARNSLGVVVVRAKVIGGIQSIEVQILNVIHNKVLCIIQGGGFEPHAVLRCFDSKRVGENVRWLEGSVTIRIVTDSRGILIMGKQHRERCAHACLALFPFGQRPGPCLRRNFAGFIGLDADVTDRRTIGADGSALADRCPCFVVIPYQGQSAGSSHIAATCSGNGLGAHCVAEIVAAILLRGSHNLDITRLRHIRTGAERSLRAVVGSGNSNSCGNTGVIRGSLAARLGAIVGIGIGGNSQISRACTESPAGADGRLSLVIGDAGADGSRHADLLSFLILGRRILRLVR